MDPVNAQIEYVRDILKEIPSFQEETDFQGKANASWKFIDDAGCIFYLDLWFDDLDYYIDVDDESSKVNFEIWLDKLPSNIQSELLFHLDFFLNSEKILASLA